MAQNNTLIVIDYDETYTTDKMLWDLFITTALSYQHQVICCTLRFAELEQLNQDIINDMGKHGIPIVYAGEAKDKWQALKDAGYKPNNAIWIDDKPMFICINRSLDEF